MRYTLKQLRYFCAAGEALSVTAAAARMNVSQPSVSAAIAHLEDVFSVQLFIRHHAQGLSLTNAGRGLLSEARGLLRQAEQLGDFAGELGGSLGGTLELGCFTTLAPRFLPALIAEFVALHPAVSIRPWEGIQDDLIAGLMSGGYDLALLYGLDLPEGIIAEPLASFEPYALLPRDHPLAGSGKPVSLEELEGEPMILLDVPPSGRYFTNLFRAKGLTPQIAFSSPSLELVRGLVGRGLGYSLLVTRPEGDRTYLGEPLAIRPISNDTGASEVSLARNESLRPNRLMATFTDFARDWFARND